MNHHQEPDWRGLASDSEFQSFWESEPIERALQASLAILLDPTKTDLATIQYARARVAVVYELQTLAPRMVAREVPDHETPPLPPKREWLRELLTKVGSIFRSERGGAWPSPAFDTSVSSPGLQDDAS